MEEFVTRNGISIKELTKTQDNSCLEREAAKDPTVNKTLSRDSNCPNLAHLHTAVGHLLIGHAGHLQTQFLH